jgi:putative transposase
MARKLRVEYAGACYHVLNRGNYRRDLFTGKGAAEAFERTLFEAAERFGWRLHAFVIMSNHYHLALETPEPNLSEGMKWLQGTWVTRFNRFRGQVGRPFQGRYKALHVEPGPALAQVAQYIHLNPQRAKLVRPDRLLDYRWSSLRHFVAKQRPGCLEAAMILAEAGGLPDSAAGWRRYQEYLELQAAEEQKLREKKFGRLSRGWAVGSAEFKAGLRKDLTERGAQLDRIALAGADRTAQREMRTEVWEEKLQIAAKALGIEVNKLPAQFSAPGKVSLAAVMKAATSVSNRWLAERLHMGQPASVSQFVRRFRLAGELDQPAVRRAMSRVKT